MSTNPFSNEITNVSEKLIKMHVSNIVRKHGIKKLNQLSQQQKNELKETIEGLQERVSNFLEDQQPPKEEETTEPKRKSLLKRKKD